MIYNPASRANFKNKDLAAQAVHLLQHELGEVIPIPTTGPNMAADLTRRCLDQGAKLILVAGGDGTVNEILPGIVNTGVPLGVIPAGTANVFCMEIGAGRNPLVLSRRIPAFSPVSVPLGRITHPRQEPRYFLLMAGAGLDARIVAEVPTHIKQKYGKLSYWYGGFSQVGKHLPEFRVHMNGSMYRASYALVSRVRNYGGDLHIARHADLLQPQFGVVLFEGPSTFRYLKYFAGVLLDTLEGMEGVTYQRADHLVLEPEDAPIPVQLDGELTGELPAEIDIVPDALTLLLPPEFVASPGTVYDGER